MALLFGWVVTWWVWMKKSLGTELWKLGCIKNGQSNYPSASVTTINVFRCNPCDRGGLHVGVDLSLLYFLQEQLKMTLTSTFQQKVCWEKI
jgi:hypothetical protein